MMHESHPQAAGSGMAGVPAAPPTQPVAWFAPPPPRWPGVIGVISTVIAGLSLGGMAVGLVVSLAFQNIPMPTPGGGMGPNPAMQQFSGPLWWVDVLQWAGTLVCGVLLLWAGLATLRRRAVGRALHLWFAWLFLAYLVGAGVMQMLGLNPAVQRMNASGGGSAALVQATGQFMLMGVIINGVVLGAYPVFLIVWFWSRRRSPELGAPGAGQAGWVAVQGRWMPGPEGR